MCRRVPYLFPLFFICDRDFAKKRIDLLIYLFVCLFILFYFPWFVCVCARVQCPHASQPSPHPQPPTPHSQMMPGQVQQFCFGIIFYLNKYFILSIIFSFSRLWDHVIQADRNRAAFGCLKWDLNSEGYKISIKSFHTRVRPITFIFCFSVASRPTDDVQQSGSHSVRGWSRALDCVLLL